MTEWNAEEHDIQINEKTDASLTYEAEIICDGKTVYHMEQPITNRFSVLKAHTAFLETVEAYQKSGRLPSRLVRYHHDPGAAQHS